MSLLPFRCTSASKVAAVRATSRRCGWPKASEHSARAEMARPFHAATTLSSRPGRTRCSRAASSARRTRVKRLGVGSGSVRRCRTEAPRSKVPVSVTPKARAANSPSPGRGSRSARRAARRRTSPLRPRCPRPARRPGRRRRCACRAPATCTSQAPPAGPARSRWRATGSGRPGPAARCRRASSRSAAPPRRSPLSTGRIRPAAGHTGRRGPWPRRCPRPSAARRAPRSASGSGAGTPAPSTAGTSARGRTRPRPRRSRARARSPRRP